ncbi:Hsp90 co-chaperone Cdc37 [Drechslerella dactyloides]|uniref:Hsp90 chaperone protein kinase-targeting subunit n=1 Tax=Drechslerella dactyloides TaxID=74499 RepID=A0AAD6J3U0_DREDA|nr:Hsp90 co-chaperone Cdc37 [Drechslerella dactyloides]
MVIDYSKWDNLELSDDSDVEVHPNVDKKSFIRWKQRDIHEKREQRSHHKDGMRYEHIMNDRLLTRIEALHNALKSHIEKTTTRDGTPEEFVLQALFEITTPEDQEKAQVAGKPDPKAPTYAEMLARLADKVSEEIPKNVADRWTAFEKGLQKFKDELARRNAQSKEELAKMEREDARKITSQGLRDGFNTTQVMKADPKPEPSSSASTSKPATKSKVETVELLNSPSASSDVPAPSSGAEADDDDDDEEAEFDRQHHCTQLGKDFGKIKSSDLRASAEFIARNPSVLAERESDGLLIEAFNAQIAGDDNRAKQNIHQALLLQYCRQLGGSAGAVRMFFQRITTPNHAAQVTFFNDVNDSHFRMKGRTLEIAKERENEPKEVEQIQLHAVDPNQQIFIEIPPKDSEDPEKQIARKIFESFPPGFQKALETKDLDKINVVLGKMAVDEAEEIVGKLSESGMLSLIEEIIDSTTEEGKAKLAEIEAGKHQEVATEPTIPEDAEGEEAEEKAAPTTAKAD